ncbi:MAG: hypothetical protein A2161_21125 [Candidatus Schekmanbacteria bacterium RBG_13_48_7]|uniref:Uncharacterized protein n=1 Tax=Candidatus Schekmanbacteria bacterium RBG_13_48_7 TaxID=1817878 RepID=A0A1F7RM80_9BACT|nr:MAG: hypothetical protein A2161_21125 [Candidatus Schekmanbacteria bacterium RBG_13_48_7]
MRTARASKYCSLDNPSIAISISEAELKFPSISIEPKRITFVTLNQSTRISLSLKAYWYASCLFFSDSAYSSVSLLSHALMYDSYSFFVNYPKDTL